MRSKDRIRQKMAAPKRVLRTRHEHCQSRVVGYELGITGGIFDRDGSVGIVNVNKDHRLIEKLGFNVWWNLVQNGPMGLIEGTTSKGHNVYRFTLTQGRVPLVCLYTEYEYKELIVEHTTNVATISIACKGRINGVETDVGTVIWIFWTRTHCFITDTRASVMRGSG